MTPTRRRFILTLGPLLGILLASVYALIAPRVARSQQNEAEARKLGFISAAQKEAVYSLRREVDYTPDQFAVLQDVIQHNKGLARVVAIERLHGVHSLDQKRHALNILKPYMGDKNLAPPMEDVLYAYAHGDSRPMVEALTRDPDPAIVNIAKKTLGDLEQDIREQAARAARRKHRQNSGASNPVKR